MGFPEYRPPTDQPRSREVTSAVPMYKDVMVTPMEVSGAQDYLKRAPKRNVETHNISHHSKIDIAVHDTVFSTGKDSHALGGIRAAFGRRGTESDRNPGAELASDLASDMQRKWLTLHEMFEHAEAPDAVREAARHDGGKAVLTIGDARVLTNMQERRDVMVDVGKVVRDLDGLYVPGADMGTDGNDMKMIDEAAGFHEDGRKVDVSCIAGEIDNNEITAAGVYEAVVATIDYQKQHQIEGWDKPELTLTFQGLGKVGKPLLYNLMQRHSDLRFNILETNQTQIDATRQMLLDNGISQEEVDRRFIVKDSSDPEALIKSLEDSDGFIPNAGPNVIDHDALDALRSGAIYVGAANDIIPKVDGVDDPSVLAKAKAKNIRGVAAYQANCGGIAAIAVQDAGGSREDAIRYMKGVGKLVVSTFDKATERGITPEEEAEERTSRHFARFVKANNIDLDQMAA